MLAFRSPSYVLTFRCKNVQAEALKDQPTIAEGSAYHSKINMFSILCLKSFALIVISLFYLNSVNKHFRECGKLIKVKDYFLMTFSNS